MTDLEKYQGQVAYPVTGGSPNASWNPMGIAGDQGSMQQLPLLPIAFGVTSHTGRSIDQWRGLLVKAAPFLAPVQRHCT